MIADGGQSFSRDPLQYHQFTERPNFGIFRIFGKSDPGVALQIVMKLHSVMLSQPFAVLDQAIALKHALDILLSRLFVGQRKAFGGHVDSVCEGWPAHEV